MMVNGSICPNARERDSSQELKDRCGLSHNACDLGRSTNSVTLIFFKVKVLALKKTQHRPDSVCFLAVLKSHQIQTSFPNTCETPEYLIVNGFIVNKHGFHHS